MKIEVWSEGRTDDGLVPLLRKLLASLGVKRIDTLLPADAQVQRLGERVRDRVAFSRAGRLPLDREKRKLLGELEKVRRSAPDTLVFALWDRDGLPKRLKDRDAILGHLRDHGIHGAVVGVCVEEMEAWLLADLGAFRRCFGSGLASPPGVPEGDPDPKKTLVAILESYGVEGDYPTHYRRLAEHVDVEVLRQRCPEGFGALVRATAESFLPALDPRSAPPA